VGGRFRAAAALLRQEPPAAHAEKGSEWRTEARQLSRKKHYSPLANRFCERLPALNRYAKARGGVKAGPLALAYSGKPAAAQKDTRRSCVFGNDLLAIFHVRQERQPPRIARNRGGHQAARLRRRSARPPDMPVRQPDW